MVRSRSWVIKVGVGVLLTAVLVGALSGAVAATEHDGHGVAESNESIAEERNGTGLTATAGESNDAGIERSQTDDSWGDRQVSVGVFPDGESFATDETMEIYVGAYDDQGVQTPLVDERLNVTVERPDGSTATYQVTTGSDGGAKITHDLSTDDQTGTYSVSVSPVDWSATAYVEPEVGPAVSNAERDWEYVPIGKTTDVTFLVRSGEFGVEGETLNVTVQAPNGSTVSTRQVQSDEDGFADVSVTPRQEGRYDVHVEVVSSGSRVTQELYTTPVVYRGQRDVGEAIEGESFAYGGYLEDGDGLVENETVQVVIRNSSDETVRNISTTTNGNGFFFVETTVDGTESSFEYIDIIVDGTEVPNAAYLSVEDPYPDDSDDGGGSSPEGVVLDVDSPTNDVTPGSTVTLDIEATDNGSAIANERVTVFARLDHSGPPLVATNVTTDRDGTASVDVPVPSDIDGTTIEGSAYLTRDGTTVDDSLYVDVQRYDIDVNTEYGVEAGASMNVSVESTATENGDTVSNVPVQYNALHDIEGVESFATGQLVTDQSGTATERIAIPRDVRPDAGYTDISRYGGGTSYSYGIIEFPGELSVSGASGGSDHGRPEARPGDQLELEFTTPNGSTASGIAVGEFRHSSSEAYATATVGDAISSESNATLTVPEYAEEDHVNVVVWAADSQGRFYTDEVWVEVTHESDDGDAPLDVSLAGPTGSVEAGSDVTLDASANQTVAEYRWDVTGDGTTDHTTSDPSLTTGFSTPGDHEVSVTAVANDGDTATASAMVTVTDTTPPVASLSGPETFAVGESVTYDAGASTDNGEIANYTWSVSNGTATVYSTTTTASNTSFSLQESGQYTVSLTVTDVNGNENTTSQSVSVVSSGDLETSVDVPDASRYGENTTATITVQNTGNEPVTEPFRIRYAYTGTQHADGTTHNESVTVDVDQQLDVDESRQVEVDLEEWIVQNRITGDTTVSAEADVDGNVSEPQTTDNSDSATVTVTYAELNATIATPDGASGATATEITTHVVNDGLATSSGTNVTVTVTDANDTTVANTTAPVGALSPDAENVTSLAPTLAPGNHTVTATVADGDFPNGSVSTSSTLTVEPYELTATERSVPAELEVGETTTVEFAVEHNDDAAVNATLSLNGTGLAFQSSENDTLTKTVTPDPGQSTTVTFDLEAVETTDTPTELTFTATGAGDADAAKLTAETSVTAGSSDDGGDSGGGGGAYYPPAGDDDDASDDGNESDDDPADPDDESDDGSADDESTGGDDSTDDDESTGDDGDESADDSAGSESEDDESDDGGTTDDDTDDEDADDDGSPGFGALLAVLAVIGAVALLASTDEKRRP